MLLIHFNYTPIEIKLHFFTYYKNKKLIYKNYSGLKTITSLSNQLKINQLSLLDTLIKLKYYCYFSWVSDI
ncbi:hypothetical protein SAMN06273570_2491 [Candidatus Pantoea floridensis]|uniref:Uncharacterized protein n=1 Tax=Candidatus Pantoea floridensis TaxID=1938870 RepID=A0A286BVC5_9GAMM|nr:hypothetical protein BX596_4858 [Enterobacteriaceae bacterium JKS000233]SOD38102.1 hypothetical protein SAMN06273570_2491 [Pantoea floridensis]